MNRALRLALLLGNCLLTAPLCAAHTIRAEDAVLTPIEQVELPAKELGALAELSGREGDVVEAGRQLAAIEDDEAALAVIKIERELEAARQKAENDVAVRFARKAHEVAAAEHRRAQDSVEKFQKSVSQTELDELRLTAEKALLGIEQAELDQAIARQVMRQKEAELESARLKFDRHRLVAPFAGMVVEIKKQRGEWVNPGDTVLRLVRLDRLRVEAFVPAQEVIPHLQGQPSALFVDLPNKGRARFTATIVFVSPEVNPVNGQVLIWAEVENEGLELRPGQIATLEFTRSSSIDQTIQRPINVE